jgi:hypothetical protein
MSNFSSGKNAYAICQRSGLKYKYKDIIKEPGTGLLVYYEESDGKYNRVDHPQLHVRAKSDAMSLEFPSSETVTQTLVTTSSYTLTSQDVDKIVFMESSNPQVVIVPISVLNTTQSFSVGRLGSGSVEISSGPGVTINYPTSAGVQMKRIKNIDSVIVVRIDPIRQTQYIIQGEMTNG